jgi:hypothetical protein
LVFEYEKWGCLDFHLATTKVQKISSLSHPPLKKMREEQKTKEDRKKTEINERN